MLIKEQLEKQHLTKYRLSKESGVPQRSEEHTSELQSR